MGSGVFYCLSGTKFKGGVGAANKETFFDRSIFVGDVDIHFLRGGFNINLAYF